MSSLNEVVNLNTSPPATGVLQMEAHAAVGTKQSLQKPWNQQTRNPLKPQHGKMKAGYIEQFSNSSPTAKHCLVQG
jgi:hypothetical protein